MIITNTINSLKAEFNMNTQSGDKVIRRICELIRSGDHKAAIMAASKITCNDRKRFAMVLVKNYCK